MVQTHEMGGAAEAKRGIDIDNNYVPYQLNWHGEQWNCESISELIDDFWMRFENVVKISRLLELEPHFSFGAPNAVDTEG